MDKTQVYTPHLKKVLKSYQAAATTSLHGPNSFMAAWSGGGGERTAGAGEAPPPSLGTSAAKEKAIAVAKKSASASSSTSLSALTKFSEYDPFLAPPPFKIQQPPIFTPADQSRCDRSETILEGETISCFVVGGEKRLCLPQILNTVLRDFCLAQINGVCDDLHIFCSRCNQEQLEVLKVTGILPLSAPSCGLITKTDAERLCSALLHSNPPRTTESMAEKRPYSFRVYHECFGKCFGLCMPDWYSSAVTRCIECLECKGLFPPQKFVCHSHRVHENRTCHWGFDSANWRSYLLLAKGQDSTAEQHLDELKARFDYSHKYKRKQASTPSSVDKSLSPDSESNGKRSRLAEEGAAANGGPYPLPYGSSHVFLDAATMALWAPWSRISAFKPWSPEPLKEGKPVFVPLPPHLADCLPPTVPVYLSASGQPLLLQYPDGHRLLHPQMPDTKSPVNQKLSQCEGSQTRCKDLVLRFSPAFDSDDSLSDTSLSTLSGVEECCGEEQGCCPVDRQPPEEETTWQVSEGEEQDLEDFQRWLRDRLCVRDTLRERIMVRVTALLDRLRKRRAGTASRRLTTKSLDKKLCTFPASPILEKALSSDLSQGVPASPPRSPKSAWPPPLGPGTGTDRHGSQ